MEQLLDLNTNQKQTITSREIAELTGKLHKNVMSDIRKLNEFYVKKGMGQIVIGQHTDTNNRPRPKFILTADQRDDLLSRYGNVGLGFKGTAVVRYEYCFGEDIVNNLFSGYEIISQFKVFDGEFSVDWYIPELKLAIEFDEEQHFKGGELRKECVERQKRVEQELGCKFIRYSK